MLRLAQHVSCGLNLAQKRRRQGVYGITSSTQKEHWSLVHLYEQRPSIGPCSAAANGCEVNDTRRRGPRSLQHLVHPCPLIKSHLTSGSLAFVQCEDLLVETSRMPFVELGRSKLSFPVGALYLQAKELHRDES